MDTRAKAGISGSTLKMIAIITMFIDHVGAAVLLRLIWAANDGAVSIPGLAGLYQAYTVSRAIGRVAFPIFCFLLVEGFLHTHDVKKYALRLGLFALISEIPFNLAFCGTIQNSDYQNVFFTLFIGLLTMAAYRTIEEKAEWNPIIRVILYAVAGVAGMAAAYYLKTDYAEKGVFCIMALYVFRRNKFAQILAGCASFWWELPAPLAFLPIACYNGTRGWKMKYFFYIFYPAHLLLLYLFCCCLGIGGYSAV